ncbi:hypothetical protein Y032_0109g109 [Ancylostoma ceylanicum]|uniref:Uncharacterized protein n=1 Tax=Ancylostoma ceylanicum TaxID=53326 RepID=A0A016TES6_9BILA|nr:hypothetical protein Y032_0109g109 [Ancylostoma ceylanicum]
MAYDYFAPFATNHHLQCPQCLSLRRILDPQTSAHPFRLLDDRIRDIRQKKTTEHLLKTNVRVAQITDGNLKAEKPNKLDKMGSEEKAPCTYHIRKRPNSEDHIPIQQLTKHVNNRQHQHT